MKISLTNALKVTFTFLLALSVSGVFAQTVLRINNTNLAGDYEELGDDIFGPETVGTVTGDLVAIMDDVAANTETDGCEPITNGDDVSGNIALIDRGSCNFVDKVLNAQDVGAIAVIICNDAPLDSPDGRGGIINMSAPDGAEQPVISAIFLTLEFCDQVKAEMANGTVNVTLTDEFNMRGSFIAYNKNTPLNQVQPMNITFWHQNRSGAVQENVQLSCEITDPAGNITMIDTLLPTVDPIDPGFSWLTSPSTTYTPDMVGEYSARFFIGNPEAITNYVDGVNEETRTFTISEDEVFGNDDFSATPGGVYIAGEWAYGNIFPILNEAEALSATFALSSPSNIANETINIILYKLDPNGDGNIDEDGDFAFGGANSAETSIDNIVGFESYTVSPDDEDNELITVDLIDINTGATPVLDAASEYLLLLEYTGADTMFIGTTPDDRFAFSVGLLNADGTVSGHGGAIGRNGSTDWFFNEGFFPGVIRLNTSITTSTNLPQLEDSQVTLMPNPADETVNIALDLAETAETVQIHLLDIMGRTIQSEVHNNVQDQVFSMDVSSLATGTYFVNIITDEGRKALKLTVK